MYALFFLISFGASIIGAICGIGGGIIIKPVMDAFGALDVSIINFLSGCTVLSMTMYSVIKAKIAKDSVINMKLGTPLAIGAAIGGLIGKELFSYVESLFDTPNTAGAVQAFVLMLITTAEIAIVLCYFQLASEDYRWWWRSFVNTGCTALFVFAFSLFYMLSHGITKIVSGRRWRCVLNSDFVLVLDDDGVYRSFFGLWNHWILCMFLVYEEDLWFTEGRLPFLFYTCCLFS